MSDLIYFVLVDNQSMTHTLVQNDIVDHQFDVSGELAIIKFQKNRATYLPHPSLDPLAAAL